MPASRLPNVVLILADDLGYGDVSCLNPDGKIPTPHMDRVGREGAIFTDAHACSSVCTPSRYGLLTGRYCWRTWLQKGVLYGYGAPLIEPGRPTIASLLKSAGYNTACIGKWHLGLGYVQRPDHPAATDAREFDPRWIDFERPLTSGPHTLGFDCSCVIPSSLDIPPYCYISDGQITEPDMAVTPASARPAFWREGLKSPGFEFQTCLLEFTRRAEQFIDTHAALRPDRPFFLYFPTPSPHTPHLPRAPFRGSSRAGVYGDFVVEHDWSIGRILRALDRNSLADNTLVIVTSDNGAHVSPLDLDRLYGHRGNYIYRGQKSDAWDGGHRIPLLVRWPGHVKAGWACGQTVSLTDWIATLAAMTGQSLPRDSAEDSFDLTPLLEGRDTPIRDHVVHHSITGQFAIRKGRWKLVQCRGSGGWSLPEKDVAADAPPMQIYDMQTDPSEQQNLYNDRPAVVEELLDVVRRIREGQRTAP
jgi:arylsulfatase A-like enzyme